jgi:hypothetical protein
MGEMVEIAVTEDMAVTEDQTVLKGQEETVEITINLVEMAVTVEETHMDQAVVEETKEQAATVTVMAVVAVEQVSMIDPVHRVGQVETAQTVLLE